MLLNLKPKVVKPLECIGGEDEIKNDAPQTLQPPRRNQLSAFKFFVNINGNVYIYSIKDL